jgi:hypothetical protein
LRSEIRLRDEGTDDLEEAFSAMMKARVSALFVAPMVMLKALHFGTPGFLRTSICTLVVLDALSFLAGSDSQVSVASTASVKRNFLA